MNKFRLAITKFHIKHARKGTFEKLETISLPNHGDIEVAKYSNKQDGSIGQATLWGTIIINDKAYTSDKVLTYVIAHEYGHCKQWYSLLGYPIIIAAWIFGGMAFMMSLASLILFWLFPGSVLVSLIGMTWSVALLLIGCSYSWFIEYKADSYAIKTLGLDHYLNAREEMKKLPKPSFTMRFIGRMTHPTPGIIFKIFQFFNK